MTIEELAEQTEDKLEALTFEQLKAICEPYFNITRPDLAKKIKESEEGKPKYKQQEIKIAPDKLATLQELGIDIKELFRKGKKR